MKHIFIFLLIIFSVNVSAQEINVESFFCDEKDLTANRMSTEVLDQNGDKCALIRIQTTQKGFFFDVGSAGVQKVDDNHIGEIWVYVPYGVRHISIRHQKFGSLSNYDFPIPIQKARTYIMEITSDKIFVNNYDDTKRKRININISPSNALLLVNGLTILLNEAGSIEQDLSYGVYSYRITANNYETLEGQFCIDDSLRDYNFALKPFVGSLSIQSQPFNGDVYLDDLYIGNTPLMVNQLMVGPHNLYVKLEDYKTYETSIDITRDDTTMINVEFLPVEWCNLTLSLKGIKEKPILFIDNINKGYISSYITMRVEKGYHDIRVEDKYGIYYQKKHYVKNAEENININVKPLKVNLDDVIELNGFNDVSHYTYLGYVEGKYNGYTAFSSINEKNRKRCINQLKKKAAKMNGSKILIMNEYGTTFWVRIRANVYK